MRVPVRIGQQRLGPMRSVEIGRACWVMSGLLFSKLIIYTAGGQHVKSEKVLFILTV